MKLSIIGDSHSVGIGNGFYDLKKSSDVRLRGTSVKACKLFSFPESLSPFHEEREGNIFFKSESVMNNFENQIGVKSIHRDRNCTYLIVMPLTTNVILRRAQWKKFLPWQFSGDKQPLSDQVFEAICLNYFRHIFDFLNSLKNIGVHFFVVESPPIRDDDIAIGRIVTNDNALLLDHYIRRVLFAALSDAAIPFIRLFPGCFSGEVANSFLRRDFNQGTEGDFMHANRLFGFEYAKHIVDQISFSRSV